MRTARVELPAGGIPTGELRRAVVGLGLASGALLGIVLVLALGTYAVFRVSQTIAPGVQVGPIAVGGLRLEEAAARIEATYNGGQTVIAVDTRDPGRVWETRPGDFGLSVDAFESARQAYAFARQDDLLSNVSLLVKGFTNGWQLDPVVIFDSPQARGELERWAERVAIAADDAQLGLEAGQVVSVPGRWGTRLDVDGSLALLAADPPGLLLRYGFIPLATQPVAPRIADVTTAAAEVEGYLSQAISLRFYDPVADEWLDWVPSRSEIGSWLRIEAQADRLSVGVAESAVRASIDGIAVGEDRSLDREIATGLALAELAGAETDPIVLRYLPRFYQVLPQDTLISISFKVGIPYWKWLEANPQVSARGLVPGESLTIPPKDSMLELPIILGKRIVISIGEQRMWVYQDGELIREHVVSTGIPNSPTMPGIFQIKAHFENAYASNWDLYMPHFLGIYHAVPNFLNGIHGLPMLSNGVRLWANVLGRPASYGCVILDLEAAEQLYRWAEDGVVVEIRA